VVLASRQVDAFVNDDKGIANGFVRAALFLEAFAESGDAFLTAIHRPEHPSVSTCAALKKYVRALDVAHLGYHP
jgi:hypothetical protein